MVTVDPWQLADRLLPPATEGGLRRRVHRLRPAAAPRVTHRLVDRTAAAVSEEIRLDRSGCPVVTYRRPLGDGCVESTHDHCAAGPDPSAGVAWRGFRSWLWRPPVTTGTAGLTLAGPWSPAGSAPWGVVLSGRPGLLRGARPARRRGDGGRRMSAAGGPDPTRTGRRAAGVSPAYTQMSVFHRGEDHAP